MAQPPYPPQGGNDPGGERPGGQGWDPPDVANEPTRPFGAEEEGQRHQTQQFDQPPYAPQPGPAPYGQPYGQQPYGPPQYGPPQYGRPAYGQPQYGQPQYGPPAYGQPQYGPPAPPWAPGPGDQPPKGNQSTVIALIIAGVVVVAAIGVALFLVLGKDNKTSIASTARAALTSHSSSSSSSSSSGSSQAGSGIPPATVPPDGLGDDPVLDQYAKSCYDGDMSACDTLYNDSEVNSAYETYGGTCAGRQPLGSSDVVYCTDAFPG